LTLSSVFLLALLIIVGWFWFQDQHRRMLLRNGREAWRVQRWKMRWFSVRKPSKPTLGMLKLAA
jgi:hypothetical protein